MSRLRTQLAIGHYKSLSPDERREVDNTRLAAFIIRCGVPPADADDAIENRMDFLSPEDKALVRATLQSHYTQH